MSADEAAARLREDARLMHERAAEAKTRLQSLHVGSVHADLTMLELAVCVDSPDSFCISASML